MKRLKKLEDLRVFQDDSGKPSMGRYLAYTASNWGKVTLAFGLASGAYIVYASKPDLLTLAVSAITAGGVLIAGSEFAKSWQSQAGK